MVFGGTEARSSNQVPVMMPDLRTIYDTCFHALDGEKNEDIAYLVKQRPKEVSREGFFWAFVWAVFVSGVKRKSADSFLKRAVNEGFSWDYRVSAAWDAAKWEDFFQRIYNGASPGGRAKKKWSAVRNIGRKLHEFPDETAFRDGWFGGKRRSSDLNQDDVKELRNRGLPFVGPANSQYIIRNMGGEAIKADRWVTAFLDHYQIKLTEVETELRFLRIPLSLFDGVLWAYCEGKIKQVAAFSAHFDEKFPRVGSAEARKTGEYREG